jgi:TatD DNase family protein
VPGLVDTHCHLDAAEFNADRDAVVQAAWDAGVKAIVVPAVERDNFSSVEALCRATPGCLPAYGIHPMYVAKATKTDLVALEALLAKNQCVAVGEIGLDFFVAGYDRDLQEWFFVEQLKLARQYDLPVLLHIRRAADAVLKHLRQIKVCGGIAHAFNGSRQQADEFIKLGFKLGFGGAMTWPRALHIRELAATLSLESIVLETDAPDMPPEWLGSGGRNSPQQLPRIAQTLAEARGIGMDEIISATMQNVLGALPKMPQLYTPPHVLL